MTGTVASATVGSNLRRLRLARGLSLVELGRLSGLAKGTLTQVEAGRANPTIETLHALARALGTGLGDLVADPAPTTPAVVRAEDGPVTAGRTLWGRLIDRSDLGSMIVELFQLRLTAESMHYAQSHARGVTEQLYVISGTIVVGPTDDPVRLRPRDWTRFAADRPHCYGAPEEEAHALLWLLFPTLPSSVVGMTPSAGAIGAVESLVPRGPARRAFPPLESPGPRTPGPRTPTTGSRVLPQPPVRGRRPATRSNVGPATGRPKPPGPGR